jgi:hypothetical protein
MNRVLGQPVHSACFIHSCLKEASQTFAKTLTALQKRLHDKQTQSAIFRSCALPFVCHLLAADVPHHTDQGDSPAPFNWSSTFTTELRAATVNFIQSPTDQDSLLLLSKHVTFSQPLLVALGTATSQLQLCHPS